MPLVWVLTMKNHKNKNAKLFFRFKNEVSLNQTGDSINIVSLSKSFKIKNKLCGLIKCAELLKEKYVCEDELSEFFLQNAQSESITDFFYFFEILKKNNYFDTAIFWDAEIFAEFTIVIDDTDIIFKPADNSKKYVLSKFAFLRNLKEQFILESPLVSGKIILLNHLCAAILSLLSSSADIETIQKTIDVLNIDFIKLFLSILLSHNFITEYSENQKEDIVLKQWEFHDLLFHTRSRYGRHNNPAGATFRFWNEIDSLPAIKKEPQGQIIELFKPDIDKIIETDFPFALVVEERQSIRKFNAEKPVTVKQLGEFLFRTARVKSIRSADVFKARYYQSSLRPYPGGGACYELEIYPLIKNCAGIEEGLYYYQPEKHCLIKISEPNKLTETLISNAKSASDSECSPQILFIIAARFQRLSWKYESIAYSIVLKDAGVLLQTMYLTATAMELAPCAIGCGNSDIFSKAANLDYLEETSVAEFMLGGKN